MCGAVLLTYHGAMLRFVLVLLFASSTGVPAVAQARPCTVYVYLDDAGNTIKTRSVDAVPADKRASLVSYKDDCKVRLKNVMAPERGLPAEAFHSDGSLREDWAAVADEQQTEREAERVQKRAGRKSFKVPDHWVKSWRPPDWMRHIF